MAQAADFPLPSGLQMVLNLYGYLFPFMLYAAWSSLALWDIGRRADLPRGAAVGWIVAILILPFVGAMAYHMFGGSSVPRYLRSAVVGGGLGFYVLVLVVWKLIGGAS